jgi:hypothetical protein
MKITTDRINVNSKAIKLAEYNYETNELKLIFINDREYVYEDVEPFMFEGLRTTKSVGKFFNKYIKPLTFAKL